MTEVSESASSAQIEHHPFKDFPGYSACSNGEIYSEHKQLFLKRRYPKTLTKKSPYAYVKLYKSSDDNSAPIKRVDKLIAEAFLKGPPKQYVCHKNGDMYDCSPSNLIYSSINFNKIQTNSGKAIKYTKQLPDGAVKFELINDHVFTNLLCVGSTYFQFINEDIGYRQEIPIHNGYCCYIAVPDINGNKAFISAS